MMPITNFESIKLVAAHEQQHLRNLNLQTKEVRDLAWALLSPELIHPHAFQHHAQSFNPLANDQLKPWLQGLDQNPVDLLAFIQEKTSSRLGHYFEALWGFYLHSHFAHCLFNWQAVEEGKTLGELDAICADDADQFYHWELALKFYLLHPATLNALDQGSPDSSSIYPTQWSAWIGPNTVDRLSIKLPHMLDRQISLSTRLNHNHWQVIHSALGAEYRPESSSPTITTYCVTRGRLFYPLLEQQQDAFSLAEIGLAADHPCGFWIYQHQVATAIEALSSHAKTGYWVLPLKKMDWLAPKELSSATHELSELLTLECLGDVLLDSNRRPQQISILESIDEMTHQPRYHEVLRLFIVDDNWPY